MHMLIAVQVCEFVYIISLLLVCAYIEVLPCSLRSKIGLVVSSDARKHRRQQEPSGIEGVRLQTQTSVIGCHFQFSIFFRKGSVPQPYTTPPGKVVGDSSTLTLLTALENSTLWSDAKMEDVQVYLQNSKYLYADQQLRAILLPTDSDSTFLP